MEQNFLGQRFLVGGAVRDRLLGRAEKDLDFVLVGATEEALLGAGFHRVGREFPVFLCPVTGAEYALARRERSTGDGYTAFVFDVDGVTLEEDLRRRDFTVNAMALDADGALVDPWGGQADLEARVLRAVDPQAFVDDPVRVARLARFEAVLDFTPDAGTLALARAMAPTFPALTANRVLREVEKALAAPRPSVFFRRLLDVGMLQVWMPEVAALVGVEQPCCHHPEGDAFEHAMLSVDAAVGAPEVRFAALVHDLGKALTPRDLWPKHHGHDVAGVAPVRALCDRLGVPAAWKDLAVLGARLHMRAHRAAEFRPGTLLDFLLEADALRRPARFESLLAVVAADQRGRAGREADVVPQVDFLRGAAAVLRAVNMIGVGGAEQARARRVASLRSAPLRSA